MKRILVRVLAALLTFVLGVTATALWFFYFRAQSQQPDDSLSDSVISPLNIEESISPVNIEASEEYAVYSRVLSDERYADDRAKSVVIVDETFGYPSAFERAIKPRESGYLSNIIRHPSI